MGYAKAQNIFGFGVGTASNVDFVPSILSMNIPTGFVGIGTSNPGYTLEVNGNGYFASNVTGGTFTGSGANLTALNVNNVTTGTLAVTRGGTGVTSSTGTGSVVLSITPTFTGTLNAVGISATGTITTSSIYPPITGGYQFNGIIVQGSALGWNYQFNGAGFTTGNNTNGSNLYGSRFLFDTINGKLIYTSTNTATNGSFNPANSQPFTIVSSTGFVGINTINPGYRLEVNGSIYASGDITALSDIRYKTNISTLSNSLNNICMLNGYSYTRIDYDNLNEDKDTKHMGLIAQEVKEIFPELVTYDTINDKYGINYGGMIAPLIESIKEMKNDYNNKILKLENIINNLVKKYENL
jgi:hypothetical protein